MTDIMRTFQTRLDGQQFILDDMGQLVGHLKPTLFTDIVKGDRAITELKKSYIADEEITGRHFNSIRIDVEGVILGVREVLKVQVATTEHRIKSIDKSLANLRNKAKTDLTPKKQKKVEFTIFQRSRRRARLIDQKEKLEKRIVAPNPEICFGSKKLFHAQFNLEANGYKNHAEWRKDWRSARNNQIFCVGSHDETAGNQTCQGSVVADGSISINLRIPERLGHGKYVFFENIRFGYGHKEVAQALEACKRGEGKAITWRFVRDEKGWQVFVTINESHAVKIVDTTYGAIGVDINADHVAVAVVDRHGNLIDHNRFNTPIARTSDQTKATHGDICKTIVDMALGYHVPIIIEKLDFQKKKAQLATNKNKKYARMISSLAYNQIKGMLRSRATRMGVSVIEHNPAYTSLIGDVKFSARYGVSVHVSAACAIARRGMGLSERVPRHPRFSLGDGSHVTLNPPVRMGGQPAKVDRRHVWKSWAKLAKVRHAALAGHFGSAKKRRSSVARSKDPVIERSLEEDGLFLDQLTNPDSVGATPTAKPLVTLFDQRAIQISVRMS